MACEVCADALAKSEKFCSNCGSSTQPITVDSLNFQIAALTAQVAELTAARKGAEQRFLEVDTVEKVVSRVMTWTKAFAFFAGLPLLMVTALLAVLIGKSYMSLSDIVGVAKTSVSATLDKANHDAHEAELQASSALSTSKTVNQNIVATQERLASLSTAVANSSQNVGRIKESVAQQEAKVAGLAAATMQQGRAVDTLNQNVRALTKSRAEQDIGSVHPEFGAHKVTTPKGDVLSVATKPANSVYLAFDIYNANSFKPSFTESGLADALASLEAHGFRTFFGQVALFAVSGTSATGLESFNSSACQKFGFKADSNTQGTPCIVFFRENMRPKAMEAKQLLDSLEHLADERVRLVPIQSLNGALKELVETSGLDIAIVLGP